MDINLHKLVNGNEDWSFIPEIVIRTLVMYLVILISLSFLGKRGVKQLSVFELVIIIGLGSAAGDPMFYKDVGLIHGFLVFVIIILCYKFTTYLVFKSERIERLIEGKAIYLIEHGKFAFQNFEKEPMAYDEFFGSLRQRGITHLGQVDLAIIEISGDMSIYFSADSDVHYGLPILPHLFAEKHRQILKEGMYSCSFCGHTEMVAVTDNHLCPVCRKKEWVISLNSLRVV
ncbi:MAG TPA: YetF domain-containing protein [Flavobacterium sp.]|jgi:uncharacterized membrane protein YcaP (DUF421 family)